MTNIIESGLNSVTPLGQGVCKYLWTLPMFHCAGWTFPWSVTAVGGIHVCLRKIDYGEIWRYLIEEGVTHYNAGPLVPIPEAKSSPDSELEFTFAPRCESTRPSSSRHCRSVSAICKPLRKNDRPQSPTGARLRSNRSLRPLHKELLPPLIS